MTRLDIERFVCWLNTGRNGLNFTAALTIPPLFALIVGCWAMGG